MPSRTITLVLLFVLCALLAQAQTHTAGTLDTNNTWTGTNTFTGSLLCRNFETIRCIDSPNSAGWAGSDVGAWFNSAATDCGGNCTIKVSAGTLNYSTPLNFAIGGANGVSLEGAGTGATVLNYIGSPSTPAIQESVTTRARISKLSLTSSNTSGVGIQVIGADNAIDDVRVSGFGTCTQVTATGNPSFIRSINTHIEHLRCENYNRVGVQIDHAIDTFLDFQSSYAATNDATTTQLVIDAGTSGLDVTDHFGGYGFNGLRVQNTIAGGSGVYAASPVHLRFSKSHFDSTPGGDACSFDSSLGTNVVDAEFTSSWCSAAGINAAGTVITATANGVGIYGGTGYKFLGGTYRFSACNGLNINGANVNQIEDNGANFTSNNQSNSADCHGVYIQSASANIGIIGGTIGNVLDSGGNQKYGIKVAAVNADILRIEDVNLANNVTGPLSNSSTGDYWVWGNAPMAGPTANVVWGDTIIGGTGRFQLGTVPFSSLGTPADGTVVYCSDCNATCTAGGSTGRTCFRENGSWTH